jgi:predicted GTPase
LDKHKKTVGRGKLLEKLRYFDKELDGVNENNTDYTKPHKTKIEEKLKPIQHPKNLHSENMAVISHKVPAKNLTPYNHIPIEALAQLELKCDDSPIGARFLQACILGAPNAGKSSLVNRLIGKNVSAVSNKYNTTDEATKGLFTVMESKT